MDVGQGREQDAVALRESFLKFDSFVMMLIIQGLLGEQGMNKNVFLLPFIRVYLCPSVVKKIVHSA
jgi:hypothetical protein